MLTWSKNTVISFLIYWSPKLLPRWQPIPTATATLALLLGTLGVVPENRQLAADPTDHSDPNEHLLVCRRGYQKIRAEGIQVRIPTVLLLPIIVIVIIVISCAYNCLSRLFHGQVA